MNLSDPFPPPVPDQPVHTFLGLGGNLGDVKANFSHALGILQERSGTPLRCSRLYRSSPWGLADQPDFLNLAVEMSWPRDPMELLRLCRELEREAGRDRNREQQRWGPRPLDIDILLSGGEILQGAELTLPHPRLTERRFVLQPLFDLLGGEIRIPGQNRTLAELLVLCPDTEELTALSEGPWLRWRER